MYQREVPICDEPIDREAYAIYLEAVAMADRGNYEGSVPLFKRVIKMSPNIAKLYRMS